MDVNNNFARVLHIDKPDERFSPRIITDRHGLNLGWLFLCRVRVEEIENVRRTARPGNFSRVDNKVGHPVLLSIQVI